MALALTDQLRAAETLLQSIPHDHEEYQRLGVRHGELLEQNAGLLAGMGDPHRVSDAIGAFHAEVKQVIGQKDTK